MDRNTGENTIRENIVSKELSNKSKGKKPERRPPARKGMAVATAKWTVVDFHPKR